MNSVPAKPNVVRSAASILIAFGALGGLLLAAGRKDYPDLHMMLDTGMFLLSGLLALLFWQIGMRSGDSFPRWIAITFTLTSLSESVHALISVEWSGRFASIVQTQQVLRPATWPPGAYLLPVGIGLSLWLTRRHQRSVIGFALFLSGFTVALFVLFRWLPRYGPIGWLGIARPTLILVPLLWAAVGWACWRLRSSDRMLPMLACMAAVLFFANAAMLDSSAPHDTPAMVAHLGKVAGYAVLLLSLMEVASFDMLQRIRAERELAALNEALEHRVVERTAQLGSANMSLQAEIAVRQESERAERKGQRLIQAVTDNSPAVIYVKDLEGRYLLINRRYSELFHISNEEIAGKSDTDLFPTNIAEAVQRVDRRVAAGASAVTVEEVIPHDDGLHTYVSVKCPLWDEAGMPYAVFGISTDITDRKRAEEALRAGEERTRLIVETALDAAVTMDDQGVITGWNAQAEKVFGWTREKVLGRPLAETIIPTNYREAHRSGLAYYLATGRGPVLNKRIELTALHRDGHEFPIELAITPVRIGDTTAFSAFVRDISERKRAEESRERLAAVVESSDDAIIGKTLDGMITSWNSGAAKLFGYSSSEAMGKSIQMLLPPELAHEEPEILQRIVRGERVDHFETVRVGKDGGRIDVSATISPIRNSQGTIVGASKIARDISERKRAEAKLRAQLERLDLLHQITRAMGGRQDLGSIYQVVLRSLEKELTFDFGCICDYDAVSQELTVLHVGAGSQPLALDLVMSEHAHIPIDANGLSRCVAGELVYEPDIAQVRMPFPQRLAAGGLRSLVVAPLLVESKVLGVMVAARRQPEAFSSGECEFLRQVSEHVALAAHQAELHAALQRAYDDLRQTQQAVMQQERLRALGQMASGIAHDINNAISPVSIYTESLLEDEPNLSERARRYLEIIQGQLGMWLTRWTECANFTASGNQS
jgi:PAS domain S-box-containing protein